MARTPWLQASSLPSERLKPKPAPASQGGGKSKTKAKNKDTGPPKSAAIRKLEAMIADLETTMPGGGGDASAGVAAKGKARENACFCQARVHSLSSYIPLCTSCGLILCLYTLPHTPCPHCSSPLLSPPQRQDLLFRLRNEVVETMKREAEEEECLREEARTREGAFPLLGASSTPPGSGRLSPMQAAKDRARTTPAPQQTHKVLSLSGSGKGKNKKVMVASYTPSPPRSSITTPVPSTPEEELDDPRDLESVIPILSREAQHARFPPPKDRPWLDMRGGPGTAGTGAGRAVRLAYVPDPEVVRERMKAERKARKEREKAEKTVQVNDSESVEPSVTSSGADPGVGADADETSR